MNFDYTLRWNVAFKALPDMLAGSWITIETAVLSMVFGVRYIVLPMAARVSFPGWVNVTLGVLKDTSLVLWIGIIELLRASQSIVTRIQEPILVLCIAGAMYYVMSWGMAALGRRVEQGWQEHD